MDPALDDLRRISDARFQAEQAGIRDIVVEESRIRRAIADLDAQHALAREVQRHQLTGQRHMGGDVLWQGWVTRNRRALQIQLAQVLAKKATKLKAMNRAHGRKLASERVHQVAVDAHAKQALTQKTEQEQTLFLLKEAFPDDERR